MAASATASAALAPAKARIGGNVAVVGNHSVELLLHQSGKAEALVSDGNGELVKSYARVLALGDRPAWDVYLLYGPEAEWKTDPPMPDSWMHQLRGVDANRFLRGETLAAELTVLVERAKGRGK